MFVLESFLRHNRILLAALVSEPSQGTTVTLPDCGLNQEVLERTVEVCTGVAVWYHSGLPVVPMRWVLVRDPDRKFAAQALLSTNQEYKPQQILDWFVRRWQMEATFQETRKHLLA